MKPSAPAVDESTWLTDICQEPLPCMNACFTYSYIAATAHPTVCFEQQRSFLLLLLSLLLLPFLKDDDGDDGGDDDEDDDEENNHKHCTNGIQNGNTSWQ